MYRISRQLKGGRSKAPQQDCGGDRSKSVEIDFGHRHPVPDSALQPERVLLYVMPIWARGNNDLAGDCGLVGLAVVAAATSNDADQGPYELQPIDELTARQKMAELKPVS